MTVLVPTKTAKIWDAYAEAHQRRYGTAPVRNAKVNGQLSKVIDRIGADSSPGVAAFYVSLADAFYVRVRHSTDILLRDCEGLHTRWVTGDRGRASPPKSMVEYLTKQFPENRTGEA